MMKFPKLTLIVFSLLLFLPLGAIAKAAPHIIHFSPQELKDLRGHYSSVQGYVYIDVKGKYVSTRIDGKHIQLVKKSDGRIYPRYKFLRIFPISMGTMSFSIKKQRGKLQILMHPAPKKSNKSKVVTVAQKFNATAIPAFWKKHLGKYKATLIKGKSTIKKIRLTIERGVLVAYINQITKPYPLLAKSASNLYSPSAGHNKMQPIKIASDANKILLQYSKNKLSLQKI